MDINWLKGFIEGEGCFYIDIRLKPQTAVRFVIQVAQKERKPLLDIHKSFKTGIICTHITKGGKFHSLQIWNANDIKKILDILDLTQWHTKKYKDYKLFKEAFELYANRDRNLVVKYNIELLYKLANIKHKMKMNRR